MFSCGEREVMIGGCASSQSYGEPMLLVRVTENAWVVEIVRKDGAAYEGTHRASAAVGVGAGVVEGVL
jgi:hypothetical protein